jgi:hypothetical protein
MFAVAVAQPETSSSSAGGERGPGLPRRPVVGAARVVARA